MKRKNRGFTLIEILIVISILAILGVAVIPALLNVDYPARAVTTINNLQAIRGAIRLYKLKSGDYPDPELTALYLIPFKDGGVEKTLLDDGVMPPELISSNEKGLKGDPANRKVHTSLNSAGGWYYDAGKAKVSVNWNQTLDDNWEQYKGENPSEW